MVIMARIHVTQVDGYGRQWHHNATRWADGARVDWRVQNELYYDGTKKTMQCQEGVEMMCKIAVEVSKSS